MLQGAVALDVRHDDAELLQQSLGHHLSVAVTPVCFRAHHRRLGAQVCRLACGGGQLFQSCCAGLCGKQGEDATVHSFVAQLWTMAVGNAPALTKLQKCTSLEVGELPTRGYAADVHELLHVVPVKELEEPSLLSS